MTNKAKHFEVKIIAGNHKEEVGSNSFLIKNVRQFISFLLRSMFR